ncbi:MAG TPA: 30S ribosomal protein S8e [Nanoarchaeota archaeon]|nr:30S ribosomal protein S8e [Nanoarchaeota archaeon]
MVQWHGRSKRKPTGGKYKPHRKKKKYERGRDYIPVKIGETKRKVIRVRGGNIKVRLLQANECVLFPGGEKVKILAVKENPANPDFVRMNIITKGAIIETEKGLAKVVSRPGQDGVINAVLLESEKQ